MHSIKVRSLVSTMALFTPTHFFAYNDNRHEDIYSPFTLGAVVTRTALTRDGTVVLTKTFPVHTMKNDRASAVSNCRILLTTPT